MQYLLERLAEPVRGHDLRAAVREQIRRVVESHGGPGAVGLELMGLNLPRLAGFGYACREDAERYAAAILALIERHEPRLRQPRVSVEPAAGAATPVQVRVTGWLAGLQEPHSFEFEPPRRG